MEDGGHDCSRQRSKCSHGASARANHANSDRQASTDLITFQQLNIRRVHKMPPPRILSALLRARVQPQQQCLRRFAAARSATTTPPSLNPSDPVVPWKTPTSVWSPENLIPPPKDGEILMERRPNRALPPYVPIPPSSQSHV
jgi:hypothetical protein